MAQIIFLLVAIMATIQFVSGVCKEYELEGINLAYPAKSQPPNGWFPLYTQDINLQRLASKASSIPQSKPADFKGNETYCFSIYLKNFGKVNAKCQYDIPTFQKGFCELSREGPPTPNVPQRMYYRSSMIASDNSTYFILVECLNEGADETFVVFSSKPSVDAAKWEEITIKLKKVGFTMKDGKTKEDPVKVDMGCKNANPINEYANNQPFTGFQFLNGR